MDNLFILQGSFMDTQVGNSSFNIPPESLGTFGTLSVIFWVPVYDQIIVPLTRKLTGHPNGLAQLQRIGNRHFISIFSMLSAGILEVIRLDIVKRHNNYDIKPVPISICWQVPQFLIITMCRSFHPGVLLWASAWLYEELWFSLAAHDYCIRELNKLFTCRHCYKSDNSGWGAWMVIGQSELRETTELLAFGCFECAKSWDFCGCCKVAYE